MFSVAADPRDGFPGDSSLINSLLSVAGFSVLITVSCDEDVEEAGVGFRVAPHSYFHFFLVLDFSVYLLTSNTESCDEDVEEAGVDKVEELVDRPGTTSGT